MDITLFTLAQYAALADGNKLVIAGTVNQIEVSRHPGAPHPDTTTIVLPPLALAMIARCSIAEGTVHKPSLRVVNEDEEPIAEDVPMTWNFIVNKHGRPMMMNQVVNLQGLAVPRPGDYRFQVVVNDKVIGEADFYVIGLPRLKALVARWEKLLAAMLTDRKPRSYTYEDAALVLSRLGFSLAPRRSGSHRLWRIVVADPTGPRSVYVGLIERGHGTLPPEYVKTMVRILRDNALVTDEV